MNEFFLKIINMSISASWLIFAVLITRFVFEISENRQSPLLNHNL